MLRAVLILSATLIVACAVAFGGYQYAQFRQNRPMFSEAVDRPVLWKLIQPWLLELTIPTADGHAVLIDQPLNLVLVFQDRADAPWSRMYARASVTEIDVAYDGEAHRIFVPRQRDMIFIIRPNGTHASYRIDPGQAEQLRERLLAYSARDYGLKYVLTNEVIVGHDVLNEFREQPGEAHH